MKLVLQPGRIVVRDGKVARVIVNDEARDLARLMEENAARTGRGVLFDACEDRPDPVYLERDVVRRIARVVLAEERSGMREEYELTPV